MWHAFLFKVLIRVAEFTAMVDPWKGRIVTDSQSVLKTLGGGDVDPQEAEEPVRIDGNTVVLDVLCPDWDILIEIQNALLQLPDLTLKYSKAHQDDVTPYAQLPLYAQLNVDADTLASEFQDAHVSVRPILLMTPSTRVLLHLPQGSNTGKFASTLRTAYSGPPLLQAIQSKNSWSDSTAESVHCEAHALSLGKHSNRSTHYTELAHNILPTNSWLNKLDKGKRPCPCCVEPREDQDHILRCPAATRNRWRHEFLKSVAD